MYYIMEILLIVLIVLIVSYYNNVPVHEFFTEHLKKYSAPVYNNNCLTDKPYGSPGTNHMNKYWQHRVKNWAIEYSPERVRGDIDTVRSSNESYTIEKPAQILTHKDVGKNQPEKYQCLNHWLAKAPNFKGNRVYSSPNIVLEMVKTQGDFRHIKDIDIDDNYHTRSK